MNPEQTLERDERTVAVENASYRWAAYFLTYALLIDAVYRSWARREAAWDLMLMVVIGGGIAAFYQGREKTLSRGWLKKTVLVLSLAAVIAFVLAMSRILR